MKFVLIIIIFASAPAASPTVSQIPFEDGPACVAAARLLEQDFDGKNVKRPGVAYALIARCFPLSARS